MKSYPVKKNFILLAVGSLLALHLQVAKAQNEETNVNSSSADEECVIKEDQYR